MPRPSQLSFLPKIRLDHGGDLGKGKRKIARPFDPKRPLHVVLRSSRAQGKWSFLHPSHSKQVQQMIQETAQRHGIRIYRLANVGNHLHLLLSSKRKQDFQAFLRVIAGAIASWVTGAKKSNPVGRFWDQLAYSRIVSWGREFRTIHAYLIKNLFEAAGLWDREKHPDLRVVSLSPE
jgi:REP element-mobilizing transposase RayT